jgi:hypothetical protein
MSLLGLIFFGIIIYFLYKNLRGIFGEVFGSSHKQQPYRQNPDEQTTANNKPEKNKIVKEDEGEYVDFEEIKDDKKGH